MSIRLVFFGNINECHVARQWKFVFAVCLADLTFYVVAVHGMFEPFFRNAYQETGRRAVVAHYEYRAERIRKKASAFGK